MFYDPRLQKINRQNVNVRMTEASKNLAIINQVETTLD